MTAADRHQQQIARQDAQMPEAMRAVMSPAQAVRQTTRTTKGKYERYGKCCECGGRKQRGDEALCEDCQIASMRRR